jgi:SAM-dependent methyltransferase
MESAEKTAASRFFEEWRVYDQILAHNSMHHDDIFRDLEKFFADRYGARPFSILDLGCGSAQHLARALKGRRVAGYVGYDLSETALAHASRNLAALGCPVDLRLGDLLEGVGNGEQKFDLIFSSFALHHLSSSGKREFFQSAQRAADREWQLGADRYHAR